MSDRYILVAEDNPGDIFLIQESLKPLNVRMEIAQNGDEAIELIGTLEADPARLAPSLALLDLNLPRRPGLDVLQRLRDSAHFAHVPVVVISSSDYRDDRERAAALGVARYFRKPTDLDEYFALAELLRPLLTDR